MTDSNLNIIISESSSTVLTCKAGDWRMRAYERAVPKSRKTNAEMHYLSGLPFWMLMNDFFEILLWWCSKKLQILLRKYIGYIGFILVCSFLIYQADKSRTKIRLSGKKKWRAKDWREKKALKKPTKRGGKKEKRALIPSGKSEHIIRERARS